VRLPQVLGRPALADGQTDARLGALANIRVLAVEDETDTRELIATILKAAGAEVAVATSVDEALDALAAAPPDVVLCDISMPGRDGYELVKEARSRPGPPSRIPFVAVTAHVQGADQQRSLAAGFAAHMSKPVDPAELVEVVRSIARR
jgi:CheY-like chemotaxis protein